MKSQSTILPTAYFPSILYICNFLKFKEINIECYENYVKQTFRNRCTIIGPNGKQNLIIPVKKGNSKIQIKDLQISYAENWQKNHLFSLKTAYNSSPFFEYYIHEFDYVFNKKIKYLFELNNRILSSLSSLLKINTKISFTKCYNNNNSFLLKQHNNLPKYHQVFDYKFGFIPNVSILDLLFNLGPDSRNYLSNYLKNL